MIHYMLLMLCTLAVLGSASGQGLERKFLFQMNFPEGPGLEMLPRFGVDGSRILLAGACESIYTLGPDSKWRSAPVLPERLLLESGHWVVANTFIALSFRDHNENAACSTYVFDKELNYLRSAEHIRGPHIIPVLYNFGDTLVTTGDLYCAISIDGGGTWNRTQVLTRQLPYAVAKNRNGAITCFGEDSIIVTTDAGQSWQRDARWPRRTEWFYEWTDSVWLAGIGGGSAFVKGLYETRDAGTSWKLLDTIRCSNTGRGISTSVLQRTVIWFDARDGRLTLLLPTCDVITTTDTMRTWIDRGNIGQYAYAGRNVTITHDSCGMVPTITGLWRIPLNNLNPVQQYASGLYFSAGLQLDDSTCYATRKYSLLKTSDAGLTWFTCDVAADGRRVLENPYGMYVGQISTVSAIDSSSVTVSQNINRTVYNTAAHNDNWRLLSINMLSWIERSEVFQEYISGRRLWNTGSGIYAVTGDYRHLKLIRSHDNAITFDTLADVPGNHLRYVEVVDSVLYVVNDSVLVRKNDAWVNVGGGLPSDASGIQRVQSIVRTGEGALLIALGGTRLIDTNQVATDLGSGLWSSTNDGVSWARLMNVSEHDVNVMDLHVTSAGTILATMSMVTKQETLDDLRQDDNVIVRSIDNGHTWQEVYHDVYGGPVLLNPLRFAETSHRTLFASRSRGELVTSIDDGASWQDVAGWESSARINDMTVDTNGVLYVATDSAVIMVRPTPTDVKADDSSIYLHLAVRPNPVKNQVTITVDNPSKSGGIESLVLVGTLGQASMDLTSQLLEQSAAKQAAITVDTSTLPMGTYVVSLRAGHQTRYTVLCVVR